jgi:hypothetical protein
VWWIQASGAGRPPECGFLQSDTVSATTTRGPAALAAACCRLRERGAAAVAIVPRLALPSASDRASPGHPASGVKPNGAS